MPSIGILDWHPALDRPQLLAAPVAARLRQQDLGCYLASIDPELADTSAFCAAYQVAMSASANCVVLEGRRGEMVRMAACLVLATDRADVNRTARKLLDVRKISFASMETAVRATEMEYGGITPIGLPADWPLLIDESVAATDWVVIGSGLRASKIACPGAALASLPGAQVLALRQVSAEG